MRGLQSRLIDSKTMREGIDMDKSNRGLNRVIGLAVAGSSIVGLVAFIAALYALFSGEAVAASLCFVAAAVALGLLANAVLRE